MRGDTTGDRGGAAIRAAGRLQQVHGLAPRAGRPEARTRARDGPARSEATAARLVDWWRADLARQRDERPGAH